MDGLGRGEFVRPRQLILPVIVFSQFAGTSLWFATNAVLSNLPQTRGLVGALGYVTSSVQLGFIAGTLVFAFFAVADKFSPRKVFLVCSLLGALSNLGTYSFAGDFSFLLVSRFVTGFFLAGIYPVGMKIAAGWYRRGLGNAIGFLVGALVLGTAFPHLLEFLGQGVRWEAVVFGVSAIASVGGILMFLLVHDGPYVSKGTKFDPKALAIIFRSRAYRASALGYFGHMWELYSFWAFVPLVLAAHLKVEAEPVFNISFWAFLIIAAGSVGCVAGGLISLRAGSARVAGAQLLSSGVCCAISPLFFYATTPVFLAFLLFWGIVVVGDSPQFSALNALYAPERLVGSGLTIATSVGFAITIPSIQLISHLESLVNIRYLFLPLILGPAIGFASLLPLIGKRGVSAIGIRRVP